MYHLFSKKYCTFLFPLFFLANTKHFSHSFSIPQLIKVEDKCLLGAKNLHHKHISRQKCFHSIFRGLRSRARKYVFTQKIFSFNARVWEPDMGQFKKSIQELRSQKVCLITFSFSGKCNEIGRSCFITTT